MVNKALSGNDFERSVALKMRRRGWKAFRNGYPDYLFVHGDQIIGMEIKANKSDHLSQSQVKMLKLLNKAGIKCYVFSVFDGIAEPYKHKATPINLNTQKPLQEAKRLIKKYQQKQDGKYHGKR